MSQFMTEGGQKRIQVGMWRQELNMEEHWLKACISGLLSFVSYIARSVYLSRNDTANSGTGLSYQWLINNTPQIFSQVILMEWIPHLRFPFPRWLQLASRWQTKLTSTQVLRFSIMLLSMFLSIYLKIFFINYILFCYSENHTNFLLY